MTTRLGGRRSDVRCFLSAVVILGCLYVSANGGTAAWLRVAAAALAGWMLWQVVMYLMFVRGWYRVGAVLVAPTLTSRTRRFDIRGQGQVSLTDYGFANALTITADETTTTLGMNMCVSRRDLVNWLALV